MAGIRTTTARAGEVCDHCGAPFDEGERIELQSDEADTYALCLGSCPPSIFDRGEMLGASSYGLGY